MKGEKLSNDRESDNDFSAILQEKIVSENISIQNLFNADESGFYWKTVVSCTLSQKERKDRVTALFCANARGNNRMLLLIIRKSNVPHCLRNLIPKEKRTDCLKTINILGITYTNQISA